jgi:archaellum component FlaC
MAKKETYTTVTIAGKPYKVKYGYHAMNQAYEKYGMVFYPEEFTPDKFPIPQHRWYALMFLGLIHFYGDKDIDKILQDATENTKDEFWFAWVKHSYDNGAELVQKIESEVEQLREEQKELSGN